MQYQVLCKLAACLKLFYKNDWIVLQVNGFDKIAFAEGTTLGRQFSFMTPQRNTQTFFHGFPK